MKVTKRQILVGILGVTTGNVGSSVLGGENNGGGNPGVLTDMEYIVVDNLSDADPVEQALILVTKGSDRGVYNYDAENDTNERVAGDAIVASMLDDELNTKPPQTVSLGTVEVPSNDFFAGRVRVPDGNTMNIYSLGLQSPGNSVPSNTSLIVQDESNSSQIYQSTNKDETGNPIASVDGPVDVSFRLSNQSSNAQALSGDINYRIE
jgi:hypothetical protein